MLQGGITTSDVRDDSIPWRCRLLFLVTTCEGDVCSAGSFVRISSSSGYLASSDPSSGRCGSPKCPWVLAPQRGQRFNLTFYSFLPPEQSDKYCQRLASIVDKAAKFSKDVTICSGQEGRTVTQTTPESVPVDVIMYGPVSPDNPTFSLLRYEGRTDNLLSPLPSHCISCHLASYDRIIPVVPFDQPVNNNMQ